MSAEIHHALAQIISGHNLTEEEMYSSVHCIMSGHADPIQVAGLLTAMTARGETVNQLVGAAKAMRDHCTLIRDDGTGLLDTCGTGGDGLHTFNISTATAFVCAAAGIPIAKHGNRSVSSSSGSADVLETLGININLSPDQVNHCINEVGIGFCFAPLLHQAMKHVVPIRKSLGVRTIFNLLGPLTNPAKADHQLLGTIRNDYAELIAEALSRLGTKRSIVVCGNNELDEISLWGTNLLLIVENGEVSQQIVSLEEFGLVPCRPEELYVSGSRESAMVIEKLMKGENGAPKNIVMANASVALYCTQQVGSLSEGVNQARSIIDSGEAWKKLEQLKEYTNQFH